MFAHEENYYIKKDICNNYMALALCRYHRRELAPEVALRMAGILTEAEVPGSRKWTDDQVREMVACKDRGDSYQSLARRYGTSTQSMFKLIERGRERFGKDMRRTSSRCPRPGLAGRNENEAI